jgi:ATP-dependent exoDNAse (exonuclease V) beta subunit
LDEERESKEARPRGEVEDAVRFLTIHAAKGLEFECVFLTGMAAGSNRGGKSGDGIDAATGEQRLCGAPSPGWWRSETAAQSREGAERVRLLYVALTRARRRLVLSGVWREDREMRPAARAHSFRDLVEHGLPADFGARVRARIGEVPDAFECDGLDARLVHTDPEPSAPIQAPARDPRSAANARRDHERLSGLGPAALARAARTRLGTASSTLSDPDAEVPSTAPARADEFVNRTQLTREDARLVGTLVHAALELAPDFAAAQARLDATAARVDASARVLADARGVLTEIASGPLAARFTRIAGSIVARELPLVLAASGALGPTDAWTGSADLVYRDGDAWVVVDFKTESLAGVDAQAACAVHAHQLDVYADAVRRALELHDPVRREVWFLRDGVVGVLA